MLYTDNKRFFIRQSLHYYQNLLGPLFFRCHRSVVVNLSLIKFYDHKNNKIHLRTGSILPVARALRKNMLKRLYELRELLIFNDPVIVTSLAPKKPNSS